ncbi:type II toxin-antitoxin system Phd/YefM family antitoxin [Treponema denticola]|uniref:type II toxin-antitoxin system Phd/YefM family antitoxin n=1 Tax=Treponema denticola TaxID=158 RepID=UPI003D700902
MNTLRTVDLLDSIIPISRFNKGEANKIFSEVKKNGVRIVVKNNVPECVLISPKDYQQMIEEYEDTVLLSEAEKRMAKKTKPISHQELMKRLEFTKEDLDDIDAELE